MGGVMVSNETRTEAEQKALDAANRVYGKFLNDYIGYLGQTRSGRVRWLNWRTPGNTDVRLMGNQQPFHFWETEDGWQFGYTPWKDVNGDYWYWTWKPVGKGSQSSKATQWKAINVVKTRALKRMKLIEERRK
jgi:hypothetical protein